MKTGEEVEMHFAQVIKKMYPKSSKKRTGSKEQSWAQGHRTIT